MVVNVILKNTVECVKLIRKKMSIFETGKKYQLVDFSSIFDIKIEQSEQDKKYIVLYYKNKWKVCEYDIPVDNVEKVIDIVETDKHSSILDFTFNSVQLILNTISEAFKPIKNYFSSKICDEGLHESVKFGIDTEDLNSENSSDISDLS